MRLFFALLVLTPSLLFTNASAQMPTEGKSTRSDRGSSQESSRRRESTQDSKSPSSSGESSKSGSSSGSSAGSSNTDTKTDSRTGTRTSTRGSTQNRNSETAPKEIELPTTPPAPIETKTVDSTSDVRDQIADAKEFRSKTRWNIAGQYSLFDMWLPSKFGATISYNPSNTQAFEVEFLHGQLGLGWLGLDIGKISEDRIAVLWRTFSDRNSFSFSYGVNYNKLNAQLGNRYLKSVSAGRIDDIKLYELETLGASFAIGNRWQTASGFTFGADWIGVHVPLMIVGQHTPYIGETSDTDDRDDLSGLRDWFTKFPRFVALKAQIGFSF